MKKIFLTIIFVFYAFSAYGASSDDVYLRKDVFEAKMDAFMARIDGNFAALTTRIDELDKRLSSRIDDLDAKLSTRIDGVDKRIDNLQNVFYLVLVLIGVIIALPFVQRSLEKLKENRKQSLTLEDVKKLIEENNAKMFEAINVKFATK